ncbi:MAG: hypothetical protein RL662_325 [Bacteroidota bacterium]|jgi:hypothetical protein
MNHNLEIQKILLKLDGVLHPEDKINLLKQAIQIADANNDLDWGFDLRLDLIVEEKDTSHCTESFPAFTWLLNTHDANPDLFSEDDFLWQYKWMAGSARRNVDISREQVEAIMDDLKVRMERNGYTLRGYYSVMLYWNLFIGDVEKANEYLILRDQTPRDSMSNCVACELDTKVELELIANQYDKAITTATDLINKKLTCGVMPLVTYCNLTYYLSKGNDPRAAEYFAKAEEEFALRDENDTSLLSNISDLLLYLTKADRDKAWQYFERYADWEIGAEDGIVYDFASKILPLFSQKGQKSLLLSTKQPYYRADGVYDIGELYTYYYQKAMDLAQQFDNRNKTNEFVKEIEEILKA